jgi:hypothetical protein
MTLDAVSHTIVLVRRMEIDNLQTASVEPSSISIQSQLQKKLRELVPDEQIRLYTYTASVRGTRGFAALLFESLAQSKLRETVALKLIPIVKRASDEGESTNSGQGRKRKVLPRWHSNHMADSSLQPGQCLINLEPSRVAEYPGSKLDNITPGIFYVPELTNQVAFDSFIMDAEYLYILQFTIGTVHSIKKGIVPFFFAVRAPGKDEVALCVCYPQWLGISCPQPVSFEFVRVQECRNKDHVGLVCTRAKRCKCAVTESEALTLQRAC